MQQHVPFDCVFETVFAKQTWGSRGARALYVIVPDDCSSRGKLHPGTQYSYSNRLHIAKRGRCSVQCLPLLAIRCPEMSRAV